MKMVSLSFSTCKRSFLVNCFLFCFLLFLLLQYSVHWYLNCSFMNPWLIADEWTNFLERVKCESEEELRANDELEEKLRLWASYRGQTLTKTGISRCGLLPLSLWHLIWFVIFLMHDYEFWLPLFSTIKYEVWCITEKLWNFRPSWIWQKMKVLKLSCSVTTLSLIRLIFVKGILIYFSPYY